MENLLNRNKHALGHKIIVDFIINFLNVVILLLLFFLPIFKLSMSREGSFSIFDDMLSLLKYAFDKQRINDFITLTLPSLCFIILAIISLLISIIKLFKYIAPLCSYFIPALQENMNLKQQSLLEKFAKNPKGKGGARHLSILLSILAIIFCIAYVLLSIVIETNPSFDTISYLMPSAHYLNSNSAIIAGSIIILILLGLINILLVIVSSKIEKNIKQDCLNQNGKA